MRNFVLIISFLFLPLCVFSAKQQPLYVVDGKEILSKELLPPEDSIYCKNILSTDEATYIYGDKGKGGAVIITTKAYIRYLSDPSQHKEPSPTLRLAKQASKQFEKQQKRNNALNKSQSGNKIYLWIRLIGFILIIIILLPKFHQHLQSPLSDEQYREVASESKHAFIPQDKQREGIDPLLAEAAMYVTDTQKTDAASIGKYFEIPVDRADKILVQLEQYGVVSAADSIGIRKPLFVDVAELESFFNLLGVYWE